MSASVSGTEFADKLQQSILRAVRERTEQIAEEEIAGAVDRVRRRVAEEMDRLALSVMSQYSFADHGQSLVITVRKPELSR